MRKLAESLREADKPKARERPEDEIDRFIAPERRAEALRTRLVAKGHFYCGKTFITVPIDESLVVTIRKAHISGLLWDRKHDEFELVAEPRDQKPFHVYVDGRAFLRLVTECLDRHSPYTIQIRGNRTTFPPPRELYPLCSHPMA